MRLALCSRSTDIPVSICSSVKKSCSEFRSPQLAHTPAVLSLCESALIAQGKRNPKENLESGPMFMCLVDDRWIQGVAFDSSAPLSLPWACLEGKCMRLWLWPWREHRLMWQWRVGPTNDQLWPVAQRCKRPLRNTLEVCTRNELCTSRHQGFARAWKHVWKAEKRRRKALLMEWKQDTVRPKPGERSYASDPKRSHQRREASENVDLWAKPQTNCFKHETNTALPEKLGHKVVCLGLALYLHTLDPRDTSSLMMLHAPSNTV